MNDTTAKDSVANVTQKSSQETKKPSKKSTPIANKKSIKKSNNLSALIAFFLAVTAIAFSSYLYQQQDVKKLQGQLQQQLRSIPQQRAADLAKLGNNSRIETLQKNVQQLTLTQQQNTTQLNQQLQKTYNSLRNRINQVGHNRTQEIILTEVEFLLRIAQHQFNLLHHRNGAANTLLTAQQRLQTLPNNNKINLLANILNKAMQKLNSIKTPNIEQTVTKLVQLESQTQVLSPIINQVDKQESPTNNNSTETSLIWKTLEKLVVIRQDDRVIQPFSNQHQQQKTDTELILKLGAARIALLRYEESLYKNHINASLKFVKNNYNINTEHGRNYLIDLNSLLNITLSTAEINLQPALNLIQTIRDNQVKNSTPTPAKSEGQQ